MATLEDEVKYLKEINKELARKLQDWKITAADRENDRIALMKENNDLRLKLSRLQKYGGLQARNLDVALQAASEKTLSYLIKASEEIARSMELAKAYIRDQQEFDAQLPCWSSLSATPNSDRKDKIHRVPPTMMGGHSIQPVVALSRTLFNTSNPITTSRITNQTHSTQRAVPMHMLQDVYIPLTRIDASNYNMDNNADDSTDDLGLDDSSEKLEDSEHMSDDEDYKESRLDAVTEEFEPEHEIETTLGDELENPLEGPSWLLDTPGHSTETISRGHTNLEPDSTSELICTRRTSDVAVQNRDETETAPCVFSPTVRRRKRATTPPPLSTPKLNRYSQRALTSRRISNSGRVLKVLVAKMRFDAEDIATVEVSPSKRVCSPSSPACPAAAPSWSRDGDHSPSALLVPFDAPSPNGATDSAVIVSERRPFGNETEIKIDTLARAANMARRESWGKHCSQLTKANDHRPNKHTRTPSFDSKRKRSGDQQNRSDGNRSNGQKNGSDGQEKGSDDQHSRSNSPQNRSDCQQNGSDSQQDRSDRQQNRSDSQQNRSDSQENRSDGQQNRSDRQQKTSDGEQNSSDGQENRSDGQQNRSDGQQNRSDGQQNRSDGQQNRSDGQQNRSDRQLKRSDGQQNRSDGQHSRSEDLQYTSVNQHKGSDADHSRPESRASSVGQRKQTSIKRERQSSTESQQESMVASHQSRDSDSGSGGDSVSEGRTRRSRKLVTYKEKPLNRKLRR